MESEFELTLIRHGISEANEQGRMAGWWDVDLGPSGIEACLNYRNTVRFPASERYYCSDLLRARHTFDLLFGPEKQVTEYSAALREHSFGRLEGHSTGENRSFSRAYFERWASQIPQGDEEPIEDFQKRIMKKVESILNDCQAQGLHSACIVSHSGVMKIILITLEQRPYTDFNRIQVPNGLGFKLVLIHQDNEWKLVKREAIEPEIEQKK